MSRETWPRTASSAVLAGTLSHAILGHTGERLRHFFMYIYTHRLIIDRLNTQHGQALANDFAMEVKATHQVDSGMRATDSVYEGFDSTDPNVVNLASTAFRRVDAAHYCNLGIKPTLGVHCGSAANDPTLFAWYEILKVAAGNTRYMPQRINIGPDRVIDKLHGDLATKMLNGTPPISLANRKTYVSTAIARLNTYRQEQKAKGNHGIVACVDVYLEFYQNSDRVQFFWNTVKANARSECHAYNVSPALVMTQDA